MKTSLSILLALAAATSTTTASPLPPGTPEYDPYLGKVEDLCKDWDLTTPEGAKDAWDRSFAGAQLGSFLTQGKNPGEYADWDAQNNWVTRLEDFVVGGTMGKSGAVGCSSLGTSCDPMEGKSCQEHFDLGAADAGAGNTYPARTKKAAYWIFQAVKGMHSKFGELNRLLTKETIIADLKIDKMVEEFKGPDSELGDIMAWLAAATTIGGAIGGAVPGPGGKGLSTGMGILTGAFSGAAIGDDFDKGSIRSALADLFRGATDSLERTLRVATGGGTSAEEYAALPGPKPEALTSDIAKFFNDGFFLMDDNAPAIQDVFSSISGNIQRKAANNVMAAAKIRLAADTDITSPEACGTERTRQWLDVDGTGYCFYLMVPDTLVYADRHTEAPQEIAEALERYGLSDKAAFYYGNIDCAKNGGDDKTINVDGLEAGKVPTCFFNLPTYKFHTQICFGGTNFKPCNPQWFEEFK